MRLEDLKQEFPQMPEELRAMVEQEVKKQIRAGATGKRNKHMVKKSLIVALAAAMLLGTTVFAAIVYRMKTEPIGTYAVKTKLEKEENNSSSDVKKSEMPETYDIPDITMEASYLPDGMVEIDAGRYCYTNAIHQGGISILFYKMDMGDTQFEMMTTNVKDTEHINVGGYEGVYFSLQSGESGDISFNQRIYVAYTDVHYVMEMYAASDVSKEDALKIAEGIRLQPVSDDGAHNVVRASNWSDFAALQSEVVDWETADGVPALAMKNTHAIGEAFAADPAKGDLSGLANVEIKVTDVQVCDNISLLDLSVMDSDYREELQKEINQSGELLPTKINYIKYGDGINSIDEVVESREVPQKLVYVTVEYTNTGTEDLSELLFYGNLMKIVEQNGEMKLYDGKPSDGSAAWDEAVLSGAANYVEMWYYDVHGGERGNNYINHLKAGETAVVHMAWLVPEEELSYLYLDLNTSGSSYEFDEHSLEIGYVDIRQ